MGLEPVLMYGFAEVVELEEMNGDEVYEKGLEVGTTAIYRGHGNTSVYGIRVTDMKDEGKDEIKKLVDKVHAEWSKFRTYTKPGFVLCIYGCYETCNTEEYSLGSKKPKTDEE